jgi:tetratricopeptide (TPR) repeat protein
MTDRLREVCVSTFPYYAPTDPESDSDGWGFDDEPVEDSVLAAVARGEVDAVSGARTWRIEDGRAMDDALDFLGRGLPHLLLRLFDDATNRLELDVLEIGRSGPMSCGCQTDSDYTPTPDDIIVSPELVSPSATVVTGFLHRCTGEPILELSIRPPGRPRRRGRRRVVEVVSDDSWFTPVVSVGIDFANLDRSVLDLVERLGRELGIPTIPRARRLVSGIKEAFFMGLGGFALERFAWTVERLDVRRSPEARFQALIRPLQLDKGFGLPLYLLSGCLIGGSMTGKLDPAACQRLADLAWSAQPTDAYACFEFSEVLHAVGCSNARRRWIDYTVTLSDPPPEAFEEWFVDGRDRLDMLTVKAVVENALAASGHSLLHAILAEIALLSGDWDRFWFHCDRGLSRRLEQIVRAAEWPRAMTPAPRLFRQVSERIDAGCQVPESIAETAIALAGLLSDSQERAELGRLLHQLGRSDLAVVELSEAIDSCDTVSNRAAVSSSLIAIEKEGGRMEEFAECWLTVRPPDPAAALSALRQFLERDGGFSALSESTERAIQRLGVAASAVAAGDVQSPAVDDAFRAILDLADAFAARGHRRAALAVAEIAVDTNPDDPEMSYRQAKVMLGCGDRSDARWAIGSAADLSGRRSRYGKIYEYFPEDDD